MVYVYGLRTWEGMCVKFTFGTCTEERSFRKQLATQLDSTVAGAENRAQSEVMKDLCGHMAPRAVH